MCSPESRIILSTRIEELLPWNTIMYNCASQVRERKSRRRVDGTEKGTLTTPGQAKPLVISYQVICVPSGRKYTGRVFAWVNVSTSFS